MSDAVIDNIIRSQIVEDYLDFFESKDLDSILPLFAEGCSLTDWNVGEICGKKNVGDVFSAIFSAVSDIDIAIHHIHEDHSGVLICEMTLTIDEEKLLVVDIFDFDENDRILALRAYKGN